MARAEQEADVSAGSHRQRAAKALAATSTLKTLVVSAIGQLLLAARKEAGLVYVGGVGTGFTQQSSAT